MYLSSRGRRGEGVCACVCVRFGRTMLVFAAKEPFLILGRQRVSPFYFNGHFVFVNTAVSVFLVHICNFANLHVKPVKKNPLCS